MSQQKRDDARSEVFWKARATALESELREIRARILLLAEILPVEWAHTLDAPLDRLRDERVATDLFEGWEETATPRKANVEAELAKVWRRLAGSERDRERR